MRAPALTAVLTAVVVLGGTAVAAAAPATPGTGQPAPADPATADMREMHEQMLRDHPEMGRMHQRYPEMGRMHEQMMGH